MGVPIMELYSSFSKYFPFLSESSQRIIKEFIEKAKNLSDLSEKLTEYVCSTEVSKDIVIFSMRMIFQARDFNSGLRLGSKYESYKEIQAWLSWAIWYVQRILDKDEIMQVLDKIIEDPFDEALAIEMLILRGAITESNSSLKDFERALKYCQSSPELEPFRMNVLVNRALTRYQLEDYDNARKDAEEALQLAVKANDMVIQFVAIMTLALVVQDPKESIMLNQRALDLQKILGVKITRSSIYNNLGFNYVATGEYDNAIRYYKMSIENREESDIGLQTPLMNIAILYGAIGDNEKALEYAKQSVEIAKKSSDKMPAPFIEMARALILNGQYDDAFEYLETGGQYAFEIGSKKEQGRYYLVRGILNKERGRYKDAILAFKKGLKLVEGLGSIYHILQILFNLAEAELAYSLESSDDEYLLSVSRTLSQIEQIADEQDLAALLIQVYILRAELSKFQGDMDSAHQYLDNALKLCDESQVDVLREKVATAIDGLSQVESRPTIISRFRSFIKQIVVPTAKARKIEYKVFGIITIMKEIGIEVFSDYIDKSITSDPSLVAGLITAVSSFTKELREDTKGALQSIIHQDIAVLLEQGRYVTCALLADKDTFDARTKLRQFLEKFETTYTTELEKCCEGIVQPIDARNLFKEIITNSQ